MPLAPYQRLVARLEAIPEALRDLPIWCAWRLEPKEGGKPGKKPVSPTTGTTAGWQLPGFCVTAAEAIRYADSHPDLHGIGVVVGNGISGGDLDHCVVDGQPSPLAQSIIGQASTYTEVSPGLNGYRFLFLGSFGGHTGNSRAQGVEFYDDRRFLTFTGLHLPWTPTTIEQRDLTTLGAQWFAERDPEDNDTAAPKDHIHVSLDDLRVSDKVMDLILHGAPQGERSEAMFSVALALIRTGVDDVTACHILTDPIYKISAKAFDERGSQRSAMRWVMKYVVARARKKIEMDTMEAIKGLAGIPPGEAPTGSDDDLPEWDDTPIDDDAPDHGLPQPPFPECYPGPMRELFDAALALSYKPQPELLTLALLVGMAGSISGRYYFGNDVRCNLYGLGVLETGQGKDAPRIVGQMLAREAGARITDMPASGEGLEDLLTEYCALMMAVDEIGHLFAATNADNAQSHLIKLKRELLRLYSASRTGVDTRAKAGQPGNHVRNPCVSLLGFTTPAVLGRSMRGYDVSTGELPRFLMIAGRNDVKHRRVTEKLRMPPGAKNAVTFMHAATGLAKKDEDGLIPVRATDEAMDALDAALTHFDTAPVGVSSFAKELWTRSYEKIERIAMVLAIWANPTLPQINPDMVEWARTFVDYANWSVIDFAERHMVGAKVIGDARDVFDKAKEIVTHKDTVFTRTLNERNVLNDGLVPWSILLKRSKLSAEDFQKAISYLMQVGQMKVVEKTFKDKLTKARRTGRALKLM